MAKFIVIIVLIALKTSVCYMQGKKQHEAWPVSRRYHLLLVVFLDRKRRFDSAQLDGNHWINLCVTWENVDGKFHLYVDGVMRYVKFDTLLNCSETFSPTCYLKR